MFVTLSTGIEDRMHRSKTEHCSVHRY